MNISLLIKQYEKEIEDYNKTLDFLTDYAEIPTIHNQELVNYNKGSLESKKEDLADLKTLQKEQREWIRKNPVVVTIYGEPYKGENYAEYLRISKLIKAFGLVELPTEGEE